MSATVVCTIGTMPPPPMPCSVRPTISIAMVGAIAEIAPDGRKRARHDGLVHRREEPAQHQAVEDPPDFLVGERRRHGMRLGALLQRTHSNPVATAIRAS